MILGVGREGVPFPQVPRWTMGVALTLFVTLGMGPYWMRDAGVWQPGGMALQNPVYLWMYEYVPLVSRMHWPDCWLPVVGLLLLPSSIRGLNRLMDNPRLVWLLGGLPVVVLVELWLKGFLPLSHTPVVTAETSTCYAELSEDRVEQPILLLPFAHASRAAVYQPFHQHPIVNPISISYESGRWSPAYQEMLEHPLLQWAQRLDRPSAWQSDKTLQGRTGGLDISHIVYHKGYLADAFLDPNAPVPIEVDETELLLVIRATLGTEDCSDAEIVVWTLQ